SRGAGKNPGWIESYLKEPETFADRVTAGDSHDVNPARVLWRGILPGLLDMPDHEVNTFINGYLQTYVERDVRVLGEIRELGAFGTFIGILGGLTAQEINHSLLGREVGISPVTARKWLDLLMATFQWHELPGFSGNVLKRVSGKRKGHFADTGLACALQRLGSPEAVPVARFAGSLFESFVVNDIRGQLAALPSLPDLYHWRTSGGAEVDLILDYNGMLFPIEMKFTTRLSGNDQRGIRAFRDTYPRRNVAPGLIVYVGSEVRRVSDVATAIPWTATIG
ncbi:MAG TPA: DUF4143 domain-containing protein, partial [Candidatus Ozemobacteraceae bacterium]|nr:DUF4143 domain-containing protein [Candidatus Ozemobacteraceae bacterium]